MKTGQKRMSESEIQKCVKLRIAGHSFTEIGLLFGKDHTTIIYHCRKAGLLGERKERKERKERVLNKLKQKPKTQLIKDDDKIINPSKSYEDYVAEEKNRKWKKRSDIAQQF